MKECVTRHQTAESAKLSWPMTLVKYYRIYISASLYEHFSASNFAIRKSRCSSSFVAGQSIFFVCVFSCVFFNVFSGKLHSITPHTLYFFPVSSFEIVFSSVAILKQFSSGALPPRIIFFSSLTRLTSLELTRKRTMFGKHGI